MGPIPHVGPTEAWPAGDGAPGRRGTWREQSARGPPQAGQAVVMALFSEFRRDFMATKHAACKPKSCHHPKCQ